jgi:hypothetical protein
MEFLREDARLDAPARDAAVGELSRCWTRSTASCRGRWRPTPPTSAPLPACRRTRCAAGASRGCSEGLPLEYLVSGFLAPRFRKLLFSRLDEAQAIRIRNAMAPLGYAVPRPLGAAGAMAA